MTWIYSYQQVLETARQVASFPVSSTPISYDQMKDQCEALVTGKQQKMSVLHSFKQQQQEANALALSCVDEIKYPPFSAKVSKIFIYSQSEKRIAICV